MAGVQTEMTTFRPHGGVVERRTTGKNMTVDEKEREQRLMVIKLAGQEAASRPCGCPDQE